MDILPLPDGRHVLLGQDAAGGSKNETRFGIVDRDQVIVKIQRTHGQVAQEEAALRFLADQPVRVPRVIGSGVADDGAPFLVISQEPGERTSTPDGWERFGRDLAALIRLPIDGCPLPRRRSDELAAEHRRQLENLEAIVDAALVQLIAAAIDLTEIDEHPVVTHGDPGSGNYLDNVDDAAGVLLDWETASVSPLGLDVGRAVFIGLLDLEGAGIPDELAAALVRGYSAAAGTTLPDELLRAWIIVAGLQFIHSRHTQPLRPDRTATMAIDVLADFVARSN